MRMGLSLIVIIAAWGFGNEANAQWLPAGARPVRSLDRWLGIGYTAGYHTQNPGPESDYYQPYSDLNTGLQSWLPEESEAPSEPAVVPPGGLSKTLPVSDGLAQGSRFRVKPGQKRTGSSVSGQLEQKSSSAFGWGNASAGSRQTQVKAKSKWPLNSELPSGSQTMGRGSAATWWR